MSRLIFGDTVSDDIETIFVDYEHKLEGLGFRFLANLGSLLNSIRDNPRAFGRCYSSARAGKVRRFQHVVYFRIRRSGDVLVFAVRHGREHPGVWKRRFRTS